MVETRGKRPIILVSSSSSSSSEEEVDDQSHEEMEDSNGEDDDDDSDEEDNDSNDESLSDKVVGLLQEGNDLQSLKLKECKAYLRKHGLRLAGNRGDCIKRIKEHWRIKDGHGYTLYPRSSFIIDCTGDVCKGDIVLFRQKVYEKFDKVTRHGGFLGNRTVAGRVVKESYGAAKQQHTFTVEVIWSSGVSKLPPLFPLLVKGRNLYKLKTHRQRWKNEAERVKVLSEKHRRGAAARLVRAMKQTNKKCLKSQNEINTRPSKMRRSCELQKVRHFDGRGTTMSHRQPQDATSSRQAIWKQNASSTAFRSTRDWHKNAEIDSCRVPINPLHANYPPIYYQSQVNSQSRKRPYAFFHDERGLTSSRIELPPFRPYVDEFVTSRSGEVVSSQTSYAHRNRNPRYSFEMNKWNAENTDRPLHPFRSR